jgi:hypothetical protein
MPTKKLFPLAAYLVIRENNRKRAMFTGRDAAREYQKDMNAGMEDVYRVIKVKVTEDKIKK